MRDVGLALLARRWGIRHPARIRQTHLDWVMMGLILLAVWATVPDLPDWIRALVIFGTVVNPLLFLPLAWNPQAKEHPAYRAVTVVSFLSLSIGLPATFVFVAF